TAELWKGLKPASVEVLHARDHKTASAADFARPLADATGVWVVGEHASSLVKLYRGTSVEQELKKLHARGGAIGGGSAGAEVLTDLVTEPGADPAKTGPGLGFLPGFVVEPRSVDADRLKILQKTTAAHPGFIGLGVGEGAGVVVRGRSLRVIGDGKAA